MRQTVTDASTFEKLLGLIRSRIKTSFPKYQSKAFIDSQYCSKQENFKYFSLPLAAQTLKDISINTSIPSS